MKKIQVDLASKFLRLKEMILVEPFLGNQRWSLLKQFCYREIREKNVKKWSLTCAFCLPQSARNPNPCSTWMSDAACRWTSSSWSHLISLSQPPHFLCFPLSIFCWIYLPVFLSGLMSKVAHKLINQVREAIRSWEMRSDEIKRIRTIGKLSGPSHLLPFPPSVVLSRHISPSPCRR